jgi:hypothetical protein
MKLLEKQISMNHKKISRIMNKYHLFCKLRRRNPYKNIIKKSLEHRTCENKLQREFKQDVPFKIWKAVLGYNSELDEVINKALECSNNGLDIEKAERFMNDFVNYQEWQ